MSNMLFNRRPYGTVGKEERAQILTQWDKARDEYKRECSAFTRLRQSLPPDGMRSQTQIVMYDVARLRYKNACKVYHKERELMNYALYQDRKADAVQDIVQQIKDVIQGIPVYDVPTAAEIKKRDQLRDSLATTGDFNAIRQAALQRTTLSSAELETTDELEDFDTPPEALVPTTEQPSGERPLGHPQENQEDHSSERNSKEQQPLSAQELIRKYGIPEKQ